MRPYRLIFYFFKCYLDRVQYPARPTSFYYLMCQLDRVQYRFMKPFLFLLAIVVVFAELRYDILD
ncbi:hypothetical protein EFR25_06640 [Limosilactobacillus fermentum]|nr:hypothetical protein [Limosilactobacillus fermentum]MCT3454208.1 hypothetical protein [Limosilactobacillus fermentum]MCT3459340.1 hypothetical protein [Limosilactobacillus fermentum]